MNRLHVIAVAVCGVLAQACGVEGEQTHYEPLPSLVEEEKDSDVPPEESLQLPDTDGSVSAFASVCYSMGLSPYTVTWPTTNMLLVGESCSGSGLPMHAGYRFCGGTIYPNSCNNTTWVSGWSPYWSRYGYVKLAALRRD